MMYKGNMQDYVDKVSRETGLKIRLHKEEDGYVLDCVQNTATSATFSVESGVQDSEDFEQVVDGFVKHVRRDRVR